ncbi:prepilin-type N-terminal cleavage/methylation domain-containing protein [Hyphomonas sp.]|uniref:prepilin-type N-terminal cleavage/methylation domain-containing protein n=1 Tax=Hyphomonas sp. TaxID=87 RepID=UPI00391B6684
MLRAASTLRKVPQPHAGERGLSLVEVMVTLAITALAASLIVETARPVDNLKSEHDRLAQVIERLDLRARVSGEPTGIMIETTGYAPATWKGGQWQISVREQRTLPERYRLRVSPASGDGPQIVFDPLMPAPMPEIFLSDGSRQMRLAYSRPVQP